MKQHLSKIYIILTFGFTWPLWVLAYWLLSEYEYELPTVDYLAAFRVFQFKSGLHIFVVALYFLGYFGPIVAGWLTSYIAGGKKGVSVWFAPALRWKINPGWYLLALLFAGGMVILPILVGWPFGMVKPSSNDTPLTAGLIVIMFVIEFISGGLGQELGWRGFLLPYWTDIHGHRKSVWYTGIIWSLWFFPRIIASIWIGTYGMEQSDQVAYVFIFLILNSISLLGLSFISAWLVEMTGSLFLVIFFHMLTTTVEPVITAFFYPSVDISIVFYFMPWLIVLILYIIDLFRKFRQPNLAPKR